jgi:uncharacterized membrane protein YeaQ/YmgE (transglycosylase-associated protein family)
MQILVWAILGLIAGAIAKAIYPGRQGGGILATMALGILGSLLGGWIGHAIFGTGAVTGALTIPGVIFAVLGAIVIIFLWGLLTRRTA